MTTGQRSIAGARPRRPLLALASLGAVVVLAHLGVAETVAGWAMAVEGAVAGVRRLDITFVRELAPSIPPAAAPGGPVAPRPAVSVAGPVAPAAPASAPELAAVPDPPVPPPVEEPRLARAEESDPPPLDSPALDPAPAAAGPAASEPAAAAVADAASAAAPPFEWPASTRLSYRLTGNYRGPVDGQAQVEWLRQGQRYQVHLEVSIGPFFAPLVSRRMVSDGEITERGLVPRRYQEETKVAWREPRRRQIEVDGQTVRLPGGQSVPMLPGLQDSASQFVQMIWWFTTSPQLLQPGRSFEIPLALPSRVEPWHYDIVAAETVYTPVGALDTLHVKPRRAPRAGGDLVAESWIAPSLLYLPVRIVIRQDEETFVDLLLDRLPQQSAPVPR